jgi:hypothetical protein
MDQQAVELAKSAGRASVMYAAMAAGAYFVIELLSKIPFIGILFFCLNALLALGVYFGIAYLVTGKLTSFPAGQSVAMLALYAGLGVAVVVTAAFLVALLASGIIGLIFGAAFSGSDNAFGSVTGGVIGLILRLLGSAVGGVVVGGLLAFLGSYVVLNRSQGTQTMTRPF